MEWMGGKGSGCGRRSGSIGYGESRNRRKLRRFVEKGSG